MKKLYYTCLELAKSLKQQGQNIDLVIDRLYLENASKAITIKILVEEMGYTDLEIHNAMNSAPYWANHFISVGNLFFDFIELEAALDE